MKKLFVVAIILVCSIIPAFAEGQIGVSFAPEWMWITSMGGQSVDGMRQNSSILSADGANYFSKAYGFGVEYGLGL